VPVGGDMIVSVGGRAVERADDVSRIVTEHLRPGQVVEVEVLRGGKGEPETVRLRLGERPVDP
jgi:S1-C subfamily serine protease